MMLKSRDDLISLRQSYVSAVKNEKKKIIICTGMGCVSSGSLDIYNLLLELMKLRGLTYDVELKPEPHNSNIRVSKGGCPGYCEIGPLAKIEPQGWLYTKINLSDCEEIIDRTLVKGELIERLCYRQDDQIYVEKDSIPFYQKQKHVVL